MIPSGNSNKALADILNKVVGILSENSETKKHLKSKFGLAFNIFYSTYFNHEQAR